MASISCVDVSCWQSNVDYNKIKAAGITSVIIRAGFGREISQKDTMFETHYKNAKAAGLKIGAYWYSYANSVSDAKTEANACLACIKGKSFDLPIYYDLEDSSQSGFGKSTLTAMATTFCDTVKAAGYAVGVYASLYWFSNKLDYAALKSKYSIWLAQYNSTYQLDCDIWQNSSTGRVSGYNGSIDTNFIIKDAVYVSKIKTNCNCLLRDNNWWDDQGGTSKVICSVPKNTAVSILSDDGWGWVKVSAVVGGKTYTGWTQTNNVTGAKLSTFKTVTVLKDDKVNFVKNSKRKGFLRKGTKATLICTIRTGDYAGLAVINNGNGRNWYGHLGQGNYSVDGNVI